MTILRRVARPSLTPEARRQRVERRLRQSRALSEHLDVEPLDGPYVRFVVRNPLRRTHYDVVAPTFPDRSTIVCTCPDFSRRGLGTCKHVEATLQWIAENPPPPSTGRRPPRNDIDSLWKKVGSELGRVAADPTRTAREILSVGRLLIDASI